MLYLEAVGAAGGYGYCLESGVGVVGSGVVACGAFGAGAGGEGGVFLIGSGDDGAVRQQYGRADIEAAVGGIAAQSGCAGSSTRCCCAGVSSEYCADMTGITMSIFS